MFKCQHVEKKDKEDDVWSTQICNLPKNEFSPTQLSTLLPRCESIVLINTDNLPALYSNVCTPIK